MFIWRSSVLVKLQVYIYAVLKGIRFFLKGRGHRGSWASRGVPGVPEVAGGSWGSGFPEVPGVPGVPEVPGGPGGFRGSMGSRDPRTGSHFSTMSNNKPIIWTFAASLRADNCFSLLIKLGLSRSSKTDIYKSYPVIGNIVSVQKVVVRKTSNKSEFFQVSLSGIKYYCQVLKTLHFCHLPKDICYKFHVFINFLVKENVNSTGVFQLPVKHLWWSSFCIFNNHYIWTVKVCINLSCVQWFHW